MWHESEESSENSDNSEDEAASDIKSNGQSEPESAELPSQTDENDVNKSNEDSEYEESDNVKDDDDDASNDSDDNGSASSSSPSTSSSDQSTRNKRNNKRKIDDRTRKLLEDNNYLRRSSRAKSDKEKKPKKGSSEDDSESESWSDDNHRSRKQPQKKNKVKHESPIKRSKAKSSVDYTEKDTDEDVDEDDVLEWEQEPEAEVAAADASVVTESIERVLKHRIGNVGATGSATTCYNVQERGDPNKLLAQNPDIKQEDQFLIKWVGWSHLHNTWESEASIAAMNASGIKKLQNYLKKKKEHDAWRAVADKEYIEVVDCEEAMADDLCETYKEVERIVAHRISTTDKLRNDYLIKWCGLSYADCTWEDDVLIPRNLVEDYHSKLALYKYPNMKAPVLRRRPKFVKLDETPSYLLPPGREGQILRDYQLEGVNWMLHAWCKGNSCILADEMGLGKTIQSISFLSSLHHRYDLYGPFLVVVPLSTIAAWQKEFAQWAPSLNMITYMGDGVSREQIREFDFFVPSSKKVIGRNAVLTTYEILLKDKPFLGSFKWAALAVDEAHRLKNDESLLYKCLSSFSCDHRLLITGTPLQNSLKELWALLHFIMPEKFYSWEEFENDHNDKDHKGISALHRKLEPYLLRRVKKDVEKSLPPKLEQILRVDMTAQQKQFYKWILTKNYRELSKGVKGSISGFVNLVMELKKCCNHASLVRNYDYYENEAQARIQQLLKSSGKLILLDKLLWRLKETGHRVLIFSQMVMMLDILQEYLQLRRWQYQRLDGSMRADLRKQALDHFNAEGSIDFCFLLSTRAGGLGINLATADTVIIFDSDWNPQNDLQAMSRAHRIGQTKQEEIVERAKRKLVLDHLVIQRMDTTGKTVLSKTSKNGTSSVPFDKQDLNAILKFGAAELFKEKEGEEQEPEVDIDRILMVAETREAEETQETNNDLLSSFKYANFTIDEEKDLAEAAAAAGTEENEWDRIIPEEDRLKIEESEKAKAISELELAPRQRTKVLEGADNDSDESDSDAESAKKKRKKAWGEFSTVELKRFVRSLRKFACPLERLDALAQDAELEEHSATELQRLTEAVLEGCQKAEDDINFGVKQAKEDDKNGKDKGPVFKFANVVDVNVKPIRKMHGILQPLHMAIPPPSSAAFKAPLNARPQKGWNIPWKSDNDSAVLRGVYKYGMGNWDQILMDPELSLEQICVKDKNFKPQRTHLQQRVDYLLKLMNSPKLLKSPKKVTNNVPRKRKPAEDKPKAVPEKKKKDHHARELSSPSTASGNRSFVDQLSLLTIDSAMYAAALEDRGDRPFKECVQMMKPVQKYIKKLADSKTDKDASKYLHKLGDNCRDQLEELLKRKPKTNLRKWYNFMWIFLSKFLSQEPAELVERYRQLCPGSSRHKHEKHEKHSHAKDKDRHPETKDDKSKKIKKEKDHKERHHKDRDHGHHVRHPVVPASFSSSTLTRPPAPPLLASPHKV